MPFTVAHALVAPPLSRLSGGRLPTGALAVGAMSPDFAYLLFLDTDRNFGHGLAGVALFCLPVSLLVLAAWHRLVKRPLAALLPDRWAHLGATLRRPMPPPTLATAASTVAAVLVGAVSHAVWDSFAHGDGRAVRVFSVLREPVAGHPLHVWLQYGGGVAGVLLLAVMVAVWAVRQPRPAAERPPVGGPAGGRLAGAAAIVVVTLLVTLGNVARVRAGDDPFAFEQIAEAAALGAMAGAAVAVTAYGVSQAGRTGPEPTPD